MSTNSENLKLTQTEVKWLKKSIKHAMSKEEKEKELNVKIMSFKKKILSGELKNKKNAPKWICNKCGKVIVRSWTTAMQFPEKRFRCKCRSDE